MQTVHLKIKLRSSQIGPVSQNKLNLSLALFRQPGFTDDPGLTKPGGPVRSTFTEKHATSSEPLSTVFNVTQVETDNLLQQNLLLIQA